MNSVIAVGVVTVTDTKTGRQFEVDGEDLVWTQCDSPEDMGLLHTGMFNLGGDEAYLKLKVVERHDETLRDIELTVHKDFALKGDFDVELLVKDSGTDPDDFDADPESAN